MTKTKKIEEAWLNLDIDDSEIINPMHLLNSDDPDFHLRLTWLMSKPEYFSFICKHVLNVNILPSQGLILQEMWPRKFPMLVGSRGLGKAQPLDDKILTSNGWTRMGDIKIGDKVYSRDGKLCNVTNIFPQGIKQKCKVKFSDGREVTCCKDHLWLVYVKNKEVILSTEELISTGVKNKDDSQNPYKFSIPLCKPIQFERLPLNNDPFLFAKHITNETKCIPEAYKFSSIEDRMTFARGLFKTKYAKDWKIKFDYENETLVNDILDLLRSLGVSCFKTSNTQIFINPFKITAEIISAEYIDEYTEMQCISVDSHDHTYITNDYVVTHNSFILSLYSILRALMLPKRKIVIVGAAFRQSKVLFDYMETIWNNSPLLRDICDSDSGPKKDTDRYLLKLNDSKIICLPLGNGEKIRGQRANDIIADEFACLASSTLIQTDRGLVKISDYLKGNVYNLLNKDRELETPERIFKTPLTDVYKITTQNGYSFKCSNIHQVMTTGGWKLAKDLTEEDNLILSSNNYFPSDYISYKDTLLDEKLGWLLGILVSEGTCTNRNFISIKNTNRALIDKLKNNFQFDWKEYHKNAYLDPRGWNCKESWELIYSDTVFRTALRKFGLSMGVSYEKTIPSKILQSPRSVVVSFLSGLFEGDGSAFNYYEHNKKRIGVAYYSSSKKLIDTLQILLLKFNITSSIRIKNSNISNRKNYMLTIRGESAYKIYKLLDIIKWKDNFENVDFLIKKPQIRSVTKKTTKYYLSTTEGGKNKHLGSFNSPEEAEEYFKKYTESKDFVFRVKSVKKLNGQQHLYDFYMPKTNSFIGNGFIQHNSIPRDIFETVVAGFAAVSSDPIENVKKLASKKKAVDLGIDLEPEENIIENKDNQIILSGTAYYDFNHFSAYWKKWKSIIKTRGDKQKLREIFNGEEPPQSFDWRQYSIIRLPYELLPEGFMDAAQVARSKATVHTGIYQMEFGAVFTRDSQGFFKRSLIESCVANETNNIKDSVGNDIIFEARLMGDHQSQYFFGVDPASEIDNFSIVIIEARNDHRRIVHCWTTNRSEHQEKVKRGLAKETDFYAYCARKIRDLMRLFPCNHIAMDAQGGGIAVMEALHDKDKVGKNEPLIWPVIEKDKPKPSDGERGLHILEMCQFAKYEWLSEANHGLRKDLEDKFLLFPRFDAITIGMSNVEDSIKGRLYDTLEECVMEIEELKDEMSMIQMSQSPNGRDRWDTPEVIVAAGKKRRMRKDRYSALLMANMAARIHSRKPEEKDYQFYGGFAYIAEKSKDEKKEDDDFYIGPSWFTENMKDVY
jgi:intein/homing endonuclease